MQFSSVLACAMVAGLRDTAAQLRARGLTDHAAALESQARAIETATRRDNIDDDLGPSRKLGWCPECTEETHHHPSGQQACRCGWKGNAPSYVRPERLDRLARHMALNGKAGINPLYL